LDKAPDAFRTISEVADDLDIPQHVLRFWESRFTQIRPMKRAGGRRYYRSDDVDLLRGIRQLLYGEGYTIRGVQRILKEQGVKFVQNAWQPGAQPMPRAADDDESLSDTQPASIASEDVAGRGRRLRGLLPSLLGSDSKTELPQATAAASAERREPTLDDPKAPTLPFEQAGGTRPAASGLPRDDLRKLQAALHELGECRRLLDAVLG
jgi:DNA-binding transcriptional MerR regulator